MICVRLSAPHIRRSEKYAEASCGVSVTFLRRRSDWSALRSDEPSRGVGDTGLKVAAGH